MLGQWKDSTSYTGRSHAGCMDCTAIVVSAQLVTYVLPTYHNPIIMRGPRAKYPQWWMPPPRSLSHAAIDLIGITAFPPSPHPYPCLALTHIQVQPAIHHHRSNAGSGPATVRGDTIGHDQVALRTAAAHMNHWTMGRCMPHTSMTSAASWYVCREEIPAALI